MVSECPKILIFSKSSLYNFVEPRLDHASNPKLKRMIGAREKGVSSSFWHMFSACWWEKHMVWRMFDVTEIFRPTTFNLWLWGGAETEENRDCQKWYYLHQHYPRMSYWSPQCHYIDIRQHTSQPIFPHFWAILGVKYHGHISKERPVSRVRVI